MKPQNNLSLALTYAVPTAAALIGLLWLLRRTRDTDDDTAADSKKPLLGETKVAGSLTTSKDTQNIKSSSACTGSRDGAARKDDSQNVPQQSSACTDSGDGATRKDDSQKLSQQSSVCTGSGDRVARKDESQKLLQQSSAGSTDGSTRKDDALKLSQQSPHGLKTQDHDGKVSATGGSMTNSVHISASGISVNSGSPVRVDSMTIATESLSTKSSSDSFSFSAKSSPKLPAATTDFDSSTNCSSISSPRLPAASKDSSSSIDSTSALLPRLPAATSTYSGSFAICNSDSPAEHPTASTESASSTETVTVTTPTVTVAGTASGSRKDPVQVLVRQSEEKLKQDDAAIVQAKLSASTLQSSSNNSSKPGAATFASSIEITLSNANGKSATREVIQESFAQVAHTEVLSSPQDHLQVENNQSNIETTDGKKQTGNAQPDHAGSCTAKDSNSADCGVLNQGSLNNKTSADTICHTGGPGPTLSAVSKSKLETSNIVVSSVTKQTTVCESKSDTNGNTSNSLTPKLSTVNESESKTGSDNSSTTMQSAVKESKPDTSFDDSISRSPKQPGMADSKPGITSCKSESEEKTSKILIKSKADASCSTQNRAKETGKATKTSTVANSVKNKGSNANKESSSIEETKRMSGSAAVKDIKSNQDSSQAKDKNLKKSPASASSSGTSASLPAGAKVSPHAPSGKASKPGKQAESQSKAPEQQRSPAPSNSYSSKRKTKSGSSTHDRTSQEKHDNISATTTVTENGRMPGSGSPICDTNSEASNDSGRGGSVGETLVSLSTGDQVCYEFNFPSELCGRLIGRGGKNIQQIKDQSGAAVLLTSNPFTPDFQICRVQGLQTEVDQALMLIRKKFPLSQHPHLDMASLAPPPSPVVLPEIMQLNIPEGVSIDIVVSAIVNAGHIFVQQPTHPTFPSLERLNHFMNACYSDVNVPTLPRPVEGGIICAAESDGQWYRAQIVQVYLAQDECDIKYVDYGGYTRVPINTLKQIRSDFMTLPFQAVECYLANITPLQEEEFFSDKASEVLGELTSGKMLQGQVIGRGDDSVCYVHLYQVSGHSVLMINREMVNREVVRWIEIL